ncbi:MAG TPA: DUF5709 domain-containing protein [Mycobacteriales bacterium]
MARDEEPLQPESPLLGRSVQLPGEDTLEGDPRSDPLDSGYVPPDRPFALDERDTTAAGQREGDSLDERLAREEPDVADEHEDDVPDPRSGRLVADDEGVHPDTEADLVGHDVGIDGGAASAEEAAVHELEEDELP